MIDEKLFRREFERRWGMYAQQPMTDVESFFAKHFCSIFIQMFQHELDEEKALLRERLAEMTADLGRAKEQLNGKVQALAAEVGSHQDEPGSLRARVKQLEHGG
jgi:hypothetical protein